MTTSTNDTLPAKPRTRNVCEWLGVQPITLWRWRKSGNGFPQPVRLGNTRTVCRKCYIHPEVVNAYLDGTLVELLSRKAGGELRSNLKNLSREEAAVLALLHRRLDRETGLAAA